MSISTRMYNALAVLSICALASAQGPPFDNLPEECRPRGPPPQPGEQREVCCQMPRPPQQLMEQKRPLMEECAALHGLPAPGSPPPEGGRPQGPPPGGPHGKKPCMDECVFNKLGLLTADMQLNAEAITSATLQEFGTDPAWAPVVQEAVKTCLQTAASSVPPQATCTSGAGEFQRCIRRTMYMNCPSNLKSNTDTCAAELDRMSRCPNVMPPPPPRPN